METFGQWLTGELRARDWSMSELARQCGVSHTAISRVANDERLPSDGLCRKIAQAFHIPPEKVFRLAGLLPPKPAKDEQVERLLYLFDQLSPDARRNILLFAEALTTQGEEQDDAEDTAAASAAAGS